MAAAKDIEPSTAFLFVPNNLIITEFTVKNSPVNAVIQKHPEIYINHHDAEYLVLITFLWYELLKGENSFYHPYFQIVNISDLPMFWEQEEVEELQD
mmetsp:Transcript_16029/g.15449  ORF Transcript_16029/g.15449 Transcript_16029/m.15449 type:complete len:97 (+) Transcript_16029:233-523(+)